jgi:hypothetical protein
VLHVRRYACLTMLYNMLKKDVIRTFDISFRLFHGEHFIEKK